jgi:Leucine-rich repeat (LRR) protein
MMLTRICCCHSYIEGPIPSSLGNLGQLKELFLDDNELTGSIPSELGKLTSATYIALASNNLGKL